MKAYKRLKKMAETVDSLIANDAVVADIATDHGYLAEALSKEDRISKIIATDISKKCLNKVEKLVEKCGLKNDYCQFFARVERSSLLKMSKAGELSYEDEKYFYLLIAKNIDLKEISDRRVIRRPQIKTNFVELKLCTNLGVFDEKFTKKDKVSYQKARKIKINELM